MGEHIVRKKNKKKEVVKMKQMDTTFNSMKEQCKVKSTGLP